MTISVLAQNINYVYPKNGIVNNTDSIEFLWNKITTPEQYHIQVSTDNQFNDIIIDSSNIESNFIIFNILIHYQNTIGGKILL